MWKEILKLRYDHGVAYIRLPAWWVKGRRLEQGGYVVMRGYGDESLLVSNFEAVVKNGTGIKNDSDGGDQGSRIPDAGK